MNHSHSVAHAAPSAPHTSSTATDPDALTTKLKVHTSAQHTQAERHSIQGLLISGRISRPQLAAYLSQLLLVHEALDRGLEQLAQANAKVRLAFKPYHPHADRVRSDLRHLAGAGFGEALPSTARFVARVRALADGHDAGLVGVWYVLEGSTNGGRYIAKALMPALSLSREQVLALDPHGELQRERWQQWRSDIDSASFSPIECAKAIDAAGQTFDFMFEMMNELARTPIFAGTVPTGAVASRS